MFKLDAETTISFPQEGSAIRRVLLSFVADVAFSGSKEATEVLKVSKGATVVLSVCRGMEALNCDAVAPISVPMDENVTF